MNGISNSLLRITLICMALYSNVYPTNNTSMILDTSMSSFEKTLCKANEYLGFDSLINVSNKSNIEHSIITLENDQTPFLGDSLNGTRVWHITYQNVVLYSAKINNGIKYERNIHLYIDSLTGKLIKIYSPYIGIDSMKIPNRDLQFTEEIMSPHEEYLGFVVEENVKPLNCLISDKLPMDILSNEFCAILVNYKFQGLKGWHESPVWIITTWGREYIETDDKTNPQNNRTRSYCMRRICDIKTCQIGGIRKIYGP